MEHVSIVPVSMVNREGLQRVDIFAHADRAMHLTLRARSPKGELLAEGRFALSAGENHAIAMLTAPEADRAVRWQIADERGQVINEEEALWKKPREWEFYIMISSHTDIGLHESQYIQRYQTARNIDEAMALCDRTADRRPEDRYRYVLEGTWMFDAYLGERGRKAAERFARDYVKTGKIGVCTGVAGNHTQTFGLEEMCRAACERRRLMDQWGIDCRTMTMIDNNGMSWALVQPFAEAGYRRIFFSPNQWNPCPSTVWHRDGSVYGAVWNPEAGGGGARVDIRVDSDLPMIFYWQAADREHRLLVVSGGKYYQCGDMIGILMYAAANPETQLFMEDRFAQLLPRLEKKVPYDMWFMPIYEDNQQPEMGLTDKIAYWNERWKWPRLRTMGNPDEPFDRLEERFGDQIPVLSGEMSGGWYQHPVAAPDLLAAKFQADRGLPTAEKLSTLAALLEPGYTYPGTRFDRAWWYLLCNDEHSYGVSGYQGRRVYETWMQHRDWIERAQQTADEESARALRSITSHVGVAAPSVVAFNPMARSRVERLSLQGRYSGPVEIPAMGYAAVPLSDFVDEPTPRAVSAPPMIENDFYRLAFSGDGGIRSLFDKALGAELIDEGSACPANCFLYTQDNHRSFVRAESAAFSLCESDRGVTVVSEMDEPVSGAHIIQTVFLPRHEKRIEIDNRLDHVRGLYNDCRYNRYAYYAFPFLVPGARRVCHLNGCEATYGADNTGHCTDVYMAANEWVCAENGQMGVGVVQLDSELVEFDHIHPDKTDFGLPGEGAGMYFYLANDWLQMHAAGGSHMNFRFRYVVTSYAGDHIGAGLPALAERCATPPVCCEIPAQQGELPASFSFMRANERLLTLKRAQDGNGLIARFYGSGKPAVSLDASIFGQAAVAFNTPDEQPTERPSAGFATLRLTGDRLRLPLRAVSEPHGLGAAQTPIGSGYTGLIRRPCAARGEEEGQLYLLWGAVAEDDLAGYEVYRSERSGFAPEEANRVAFVEPEVYCVGRWVDRGLKHHAAYYYRVCAVDRQGRRGPMSEEFSGVTKE